MYHNNLYLVAYNIYSNKENICCDVLERGSGLESLALDSNLVLQIDFQLSGCEKVS